MSLDITPMIPEGRQLIERYGNGGFKVGGENHSGSIIVLSERTIPWTVSGSDGIDIDSLKDVLGEDVKVLLVGCGPESLPPPPALKRDLKAAGIVLEWMDTGAACRTFNVLLSEERPVAAALVAVE